MTYDLFSRKNPTFSTPVRWSCTSESVTCRRCHHEWDDGDPAYRFACPDCNATPGNPCQRSAGGNERVCPGRDRVAQAAKLLGPCEGLSWDGRHDKPLPLRASRTNPAWQLVRTGSPVARSFNERYPS
ncbi:hypothetical protein [Asaia krungthepensis]|uniref:Uncharacterized protein n=1 Tax=Asaia krungthepensis NRIC 0535 TaxID=1307925 RepID=A0ABQ0Q4J2_9PROT|nr:hypothetical protein [Asaia krungthepensis]GBQ91067.1 hypothetical protein AA0535_2193 [Asaia krungthepensis NRIC 0535]